MQTPNASVRRTTVARDGTARCPGIPMACPSVRVSKSVPGAMSRELSSILVEQEVSDLGALQPDPIGHVLAHPGGSHRVGLLGLLL